jgi:hypothetical protein
VAAHKHRAAIQCTVTSPFGSPKDVFRSLLALLVGRKQLDNCEIDERIDNAVRGCLLQIGPGADRIIELLRLRRIVSIIQYFVIRAGTEQYGGKRISSAVLSISAASVGRHTGGTCRTQNLFTTMA